MSPDTQTLAYVVAALMLGGLLVYLYVSRFAPSNGNGHGGNGSNGYSADPIKAKEKVASHLLAQIVQDKVQRKLQERADAELEKIADELATPQAPLPVAAPPAKATA